MSSEEPGFGRWRCTTNGQYFWVLVAANNEPLAVSELYTTKQSCQSSIMVVKQGAPTAPIVDETGGRNDRRLP